MKKLLLSCVAVATLAVAGYVGYPMLTKSDAAFAADKIDLVRFSRPGGLGSRFTDTLEGALGDNLGETITVKGCKAAVDYINKTDKPTLAIGYVDMQLGKCAVEQENFYGYLGASSVYLCLREDAKDGWQDRLQTKGIKIGYAKWPFFTTYVSEIAPAINPDAKLVPYKNSGAYRTALVAGEIDFTISSTAKDGEICPVVFAPSTEGTEATVLGSDIAPGSEAAKNFSYSMYVIGSNLPVNKDIVNAVFASDAWANRKDFRYTEFLTDRSLAEQFKHLNND